MRTLLAALVLTVPLVAQAAEPLGRLFFTPEQRAQLDTLRIKKVVASQTKDEPAPEIVTFSGIVRRSDGKATVWVNNKALSESELRGEESISGRISRDGQILLQGPAAAGVGKMQLKVGQSAELLSGRVAESSSTLQTAPTQAIKPKPEPQPVSGTAKSGDTAVRGAQPDSSAALAPPASSGKAQGSRP